MKNPRKSTVRVAVALQSGMPASVSFTQPAIQQPILPELLLGDSLAAADQALPQAEDEQFRSFLHRHLPPRKAPSDLARRIQASIHGE